MCERGSNEIRPLIKIYLLLSEEERKEKLRWLYNLY